MIWQTLRQLASKLKPISMAVIRRYDLWLVSQQLTSANHLTRASGITKLRNLGSLELLVKALNIGYSDVREVAVAALAERSAIKELRAFIVAGMCDFDGPGWVDTIELRKVREVFEEKWPQESRQMMGEVRQRLVELALKGGDTRCFQCCMRLFAREDYNNIGAVMRDMIGAGSHVRVVHSGGGEENMGRNKKWDGKICMKCCSLFCDICAREREMGPMFSGYDLYDEAAARITGRESNKLCPNCNIYVKSINTYRLSEIATKMAKKI